MVVGAIPYKSFRERINIVNKLKHEYRKVKIDVLDSMILFEVTGKLNHDISNI